LVWKRSQEKSFARDTILLAALEERRADDFYLENLARVFELHPCGANQTLEQHLFAYLARVRGREHPAFPRWDIEQWGLADAQQQLDIYFIANKLMNGWIQLLQGQMRGQKPTIPLLQEALTAAEVPGFKGNFYIDCYALAIQDLQAENCNGKTAAILRDRVLPKLERLPARDHFGLFNLLLNYHIIWDLHADGDADVDMEHFALVKLGLEKGYLLRDGEISYADFYNTTSLAMDMNELAWGEAFVDQYSPHLPEKVRAASTIFARARLRMAARDFRHALRLLSQKDALTSEIDHVVERILRIKCYYELEEDELLEHLLEATRKHTSRTKGIAVGFRDQTNAFVRFTRQLHKARRAPDGRPEVLTQVLATLREERAVASREWLLTKVNALLENC
ncbi:MAG: hypothetical protein AAF570_16875, partial [Bacteroidota bacterium]